MRTTGRAVLAIAAAATVALAGCSSGSGGTSASGSSGSQPASAGSGSSSSAGSGSGAASGSASAPGTGQVTVDVGGFTGTFDPPATGCKPGQYSESNPLKAAWVYVGSPSDAGWTQAHDEGRKAAADKFGKSLVTITKENVPEGPQTSQVIDQLISQGANIIFATSYGFQPAVLDAAKKNPKVLFEQATGDTMMPNVAQYYGAGENGDYLSGMAVGYASKTGKIGFVAPFPIPEVIREINAFTMGAQYAHPGATVKVVWTNTWFDPAKERQAAQSLVSAGVDALGDGQDSPTTGQVAKANNLPWTGYDSDQTSFAPENFLTATTYHWGDYYIKEIQAAMDCTWRTHFYYGGLKDGFVKMAPYGKSMSSDAKTAIDKRKQEIIDGSFDPFAGPLTDQSGKVKIAKGTTMSIKDKYQMNWFVQGVDGTIPSS
jgi:basic membrane lipoprotein Med (substrate-binding protein (PBP1-ABC) superfamily)